MIDRKSKGCDESQKIEKVKRARRIKSKCSPAPIRKLLNILPAGTENTPGIHL